MDGWFYARLAYEASRMYSNSWEKLPESERERWKRVADAVLKGASPEIEMRATQTTLPPLDVDPDSTPTPVCVPHPQHGPKT